MSREWVPENGCQGVGVRERVSGRDYHKAFQATICKERVSEMCIKDQVLEHQGSSFGCQGASVKKRIFGNKYEKEEKNK